MAVAAGETPAGPHVRAACERHLRDLREQKKRGIEWKPEAAEHIFGFFQNVLRLPTGAPFKLEPWQQFIVGSLFGWLGEDGARRFRVGYIETGKGSGKSPMLAGIGLYMLHADGEPEAEVYAAAVTRDQAKILFRDAVNMVDASPALSRRLVKSGQRDVFNLAHEESGSFFRPVSSEGRGLDGKRVHCALIDEIHEHPTAVVVDKMRAGTKGRRQALIVEITNSGFDRTSICYQHHEYSGRVTSGQIEDDSWFAYVCALDEGDEPFDNEECWHKANPNIGVSITEKYLREQVREAKGMPAKASIVRRLNFCQWVDAANPWISVDRWRECEEAFELDSLVGADCVAALDLSGTRDLTALVIVFREDDGYAATAEFWTPMDTLQERAREDRVPYDVWADQGFITPTPGRSVDYSYVAQRLVELQQNYGLVRVAFDPYRIKDLERELAEAGVELELVAHGQGFYRSATSALWMPRSIELLESLIDKRKIRIRQNPCLTFNAASAQLEADAKGNKIFTKRKSAGRIDGVVAMAMAIGLAESGDERGPSVYEALSREGKTFRDVA